MPGGQSQGLPPSIQSVYGERQSLPQAPAPVMDMQQESSYGESGYRRGPGIESADQRGGAEDRNVLNQNGMPKQQEYPVMDEREPNVQKPPMPWDREKQMVLEEESKGVFTGTQPLDRLEEVMGTDQNMQPPPSPESTEGEREMSDNIRSPSREPPSQDNLHPQSQEPTNTQTQLEPHPSSNEMEQKPKVDQKKSIDR